LTARVIAPLKLLAQDADDLAVISAALQDAVTRIGDLRWDSASRQLTVEFNRYCWECEPDQRVRCGLQLGCVLQVKSRRLRREPADAVLELLALTFEEGEAPGGWVTFAFAAGGDLAAEVECIDAVLADVSTPWPAARKPAHG
jgi:hypothetical protein